MRTVDGESRVVLSELDIGLYLSIGHHRYAESRCPDGGWTNGYKAVTMWQNKQELTDI